MAAFVWPRLWYRASQEHPRWFAEANALPGWTAKLLPLSEAAEAQLGSDTFVNEEFTRTDGRKVRIFSAKRFTSSCTDARIFAHTPDHCWTGAGWKVQEVCPQATNVSFNGFEIVFERRCFRGVGNAELVYFGALVGGQNLPFRLNQYLSFARGARDAGPNPAAETFSQAKDAHPWERQWNCFRTRRSFSGPTHFIRVSTPVDAAGLAAGDQLLQEFLREFFVPADFQAERAKWLRSKSETRTAN